MLDFIIKKLKLIGHTPINPPPVELCEDFEVLYKELDKNIERIKSILGHSNDLVVTDLVLDIQGERKAALLSIDGLVQSILITESIIKPLLEKPIEPLESTDSLMETIRQNVLLSNESSVHEAPADLIMGFLSGDTVLLVDGEDQGLIINSKGWEKRAVSEPQTEAVIRGPREGFVENMRSNTALLRRRIKTPAFRIETLVIGHKTRTNVCLAYIEGVVNPQILKTLKYRLGQITIDSVLDSGYIDQYIADSPLSMFPTVGYTEKPDVAAGRILEGRIAIVVDGSPIVLTVPSLFVESFQTAEDYYVNTVYASLSRILRYMGYFLSVFAPAIYVALTTFHQELIPTRLLISISAAREGTPFHALVETLILVFSFEILREAGLRLPRPVGQAVSIVGALVMGDAAVSAGLVGTPMVITVAITAVSGFLVPQQNESISILRILMLILGGILGGYGITIGILTIMIHLASLKSFGVPYFLGVAPSQKESLKDSLIRFPLWSMVLRPKDIAGKDVVRRRNVSPSFTGEQKKEG